MPNKTGKAFAKLTYTVRIETSVSVEAESPEEAAEIALNWAQESLADSNAMGNVYAEEDEDCKESLHSFEA